MLWHANSAGCYIYLKHAFLQFLSFLHLESFNFHSIHAGLRVKYAPSLDLYSSKNQTGYNFLDAAIDKQLICSIGLYPSHLLLQLCTLFNLF